MGDHNDPRHPAQDDQAARRAGDQRAADEFFSRAYTPEQIARMLATPKEVLAKWERDSARARAAHAQMTAMDASAGRSANAYKGAETRRERAAAARAVEEKNAARRAKARQVYAADPEGYLEYQRQRRQMQKENDPEGYRKKARERNQRWFDRHRDEQNAKQRDRYRDNPEPRLAARAQYYATHAEQIKAKRRERYWADHEASLKQQREQRARERRRKDAGLPPRRLHRVNWAEKDANRANADAFFSRTYTTDQIARIDQTRVTPPELLAAWKRDCQRARAAHHLAQHPQLRQRLRSHDGAARPTKQQLEDARLDAIGRIINQRLRRTEPPRRGQPDDPAAPHPMVQHPNGMGINR